ncbi:hypothetical protein GCM10022415_16620 [Knoellia locipacati]|uniref:Uncharacterized protein n=1 Tax=Knoellia locipacati TaxID=882824 RepID=A0A512T0D6_9MICO|nr:hypothetical protein [Knoellia locipacati]GEQ13610.1 hypothetical protein KLO01_16570 [Knoellia locipacati]
MGGERRQRGVEGRVAERRAVEHLEPAARIDPDPAGERQLAEQGAGEAEADGAGHRAHDASVGQRHLQQEVVGEEHRAHVPTVCRPLTSRLHRED